MTQTIPAKRARDLKPGDRIAAGFLPSGMAGTVLHDPDAFPLPSTGEPWVMVTYRLTNTAADAEHFRADALIPLEARADDGMSYTRADTDADDPTPVSPARMEPHFGAVVDGGQLVDETDAPASGLTPAADQSRGALVAPGTDPTLAEAALKAARGVLVGPPVHLEMAGAKTSCGLAIIDLDTGAGWTNDHGAVTCKACLDGMPF